MSNKSNPNQHDYWQSDNFLNDPTHPANVEVSMSRQETSDANNLNEQNSSASPSEKQGGDSESLNSQRISTLLHFVDDSGRVSETDADIATGMDNAQDNAMPSDDPAVFQTRKAFHQKPGSKAILIGGFTFVGVMGAASLLGGFPKGSQTAQPPTSTPSPTTSNPGNSDPKLLTALALSDQQKDLERLKLKDRQKLKEAQNQAKQANAQASKNIPTQTQSTIPVRPVATAPPVNSVPQTVTPTIRSSFAPSRPAFLNPSTPVAGSSSGVGSTIRQQDPSSAWLAASTVGSFGQISPPQQRSAQNSGTGFGSSFNNNNSTRSGPSSFQPSNIVNPEEESPILTGNVPPLPVVLNVGSKARGVLATPISWEGNGGQANGGGARYIIALEQPLTASNGAVAFPAGTQLVAKLDGLSQTGLVQLSVLSALLNANGQQQEFPISPGAIQINGKGGKPLIASSKKIGGGNGFLSAISSTVLGAARGAAEQLTRSDTTVTSSSVGSTVTSSTGDRNPFAGAVQGGSDRLLTNLERQVGSSSQQPVGRIWYAEAGTKVEVFVSQSVKVPMLYASGLPGAQASKPSQTQLPPNAQQLPWRTQETAEAAQQFPLQTQQPLAAQQFPLQTQQPLAEQEEPLEVPLQTQPQVLPLQPLESQPLVQPQQPAEAQQPLQTQLPLDAQQPLETQQPMNVASTFQSSGPTDLEQVNLEEDMPADFFSRQRSIEILYNQPES